MSELKYFFSTDGEVGTMPAIHSFVYLKSEADKVIAHNKYKRCLAMAKWCDDAARLATWDKDYHRCGWYNKWMRRWLELAEKFKQNNEVNNGDK